VEAIQDKMEANLDTAMSAGHEAMEAYQERIEAGQENAEPRCTPT
jgi:hypothetical protein